MLLVSDFFSILQTNQQNLYSYFRRQCCNQYFSKLRCFLTVGVPHLLLSLLHVCKVIDDGFRQVLQSPQLDLKGLQLLHLGNLGGTKQVLILQPCKSDAFL